MVGFAGWEMPVQYSSVIAEHDAVRASCGVFDISHMGQLVVEGEVAEVALNRLLTNDVSRLENGEGQYSIMLNEEGGVIDDLIVYREVEGRYFLVVNASMVNEDVVWLREHLPENALLDNQSADWAGLAVQGPQAMAVATAVGLAEDMPERNGFYRIGEGLLCRTGYTGEDGFEFFCPAAEGAHWFERFVEAGATPCGLAARDSLRLEMGYPLNGSDLTPEHSPVEAGLSVFVDLEKGEFVGRSRCIADKRTLGRKLTALATVGKGPPPRAHYPVHSPEGVEIGETTSGMLSPTSRVGIALAYLPTDYAKPGRDVFIEVRGRMVAARTIEKSQLKDPPR